MTMPPVTVLLALVSWLVSGAIEALTPAPKRRIGSHRRARDWSRLGALALVALPMPGAFADDLTPDDMSGVKSAFDQVFSPAQRLPARADLAAFSGQIAQLADARRGRIGVAALDLVTGKRIDVLGDQPFPLASTGKLAISATFLDMVDRGRVQLTDSFPLMVPLPSKKFAGAVAPVRAGARLTALSLIELSITRSDNQATDALLAAVGGPGAVNAWLRRAGIGGGFHLDRDIATLVRDDGAVDPAVRVDTRDAATPQAMVRLLTGLYRGDFLSGASRQVLLGAMSRCLTGVRRMRADLPPGATVAHKTGTLFNTSSDVGIITTPDGHPMAVAIYVTGQGSKPAREARIATISRAIYDGYTTAPTAPAALLPHTAYAPIAAAALPGAR